MSLKLGSLFDGSGTCPLAATLCGIEPVWASEIEDFPMRVTKKNFPNVIHLGDITKINGAEIPPVDIISGGSPCQDLSVAGRRAGLQNGERSHLFYEMCRVIEEMRKATDGKYPRVVIWENVPGALSSGKPKGGDFFEVIRSFAEIAEPGIYVPEPQKGKDGRYIWKPAGSVVGDGFSISWRLMDAQHWGVAQRRKRLFLIAEYRGISDPPRACDPVGYPAVGRAGEILFKRKGVSGDFAKGIGAWQRFTGDIEDSTGAADSGQIGRVISLDNHPMDSRVTIIETGITNTLNARMGTGGGTFLW